MLRILLICVHLFVINSSVIAQKINEPNSIKYPAEISKLNLERLYDKSKWYMYCIHCDKNLDFKYEEDYPKSPIKYASLPIEFDKMSIRGDTVEINFYFYYGKRKVDERLVWQLPYWGTVSLRKNNNIVMYSSRSQMHYTWIRCTEKSICPYREVYPLQPEVIKYIRANRKTLDPWFLQEAIKRGVIKE